MALVMLLSAGLARGQVTGAPVHEVNREDTLWGIAARYLNDGPRWHEIYALNGSSITTFSGTAASMRSARKRPSMVPR